MRRSNRRSTAPTPGETDANPPLPTSTLIGTRGVTRSTRQSSKAASVTTSGVASDTTSEVSGPSAPKRGRSRKTGATKVDIQYVSRSVFRITVVVALFFS
jgi:hypothetical protein